MEKVNPPREDESRLLCVCLPVGSAAQPGLKRWTSCTRSREEHPRPAWARASATLASLIDFLGERGPGLFDTRRESHPERWTTRRTRVIGREREGNGEKGKSMRTVIERVGRRVKIRKDDE